MYVDKSDPKAPVPKLEPVYVKLDGDYEGMDDARTMVLARIMKPQIVNRKLMMVAKRIEEMGNRGMVEVPETHKQEGKLNTWTSWLMKEMRVMEGDDDEERARLLKEYIEQGDKPLYIDIKEEWKQSAEKYTIMPATGYTAQRFEPEAWQLHLFHTRKAEAREEQRRMQAMGELEDEIENVRSKYADMAAEMVTQMDQHHQVPGRNP